ncbi:MAG: hypothetical protein SFU56_02980 [Capsulimonadales bacterium]|nr:hypothetical protein [Capsulimonadales bacterium]
MVHVRFNGRSTEMDERQLKLTVGMNDADIKARIARHLEIDVRRLDGYVVDRTPTGNIVLRPEAVYG